MREVTWTDRNGWRHRSMVRDTDTDSAAPQGLSFDPPDMNDLDWEGVKKDIHNALIDRGIVNWRDLQRSQSTRSIIISALKPRLVFLFKGAER